MALITVPGGGPVQGLGSSHKVLIGTIEIILSTLHNIEYVLKVLLF